MSKFWVVFGQVYKKNVKSGAWLSLVISPIVAMVVMAGIGWLTAQSASDATIAVVADNPAIVKVLNEADDDATYKAMSAKQADKKFNAETVDGILTVTTQPQVTADYLANSSAKGSASIMVVESVLSQLNTVQTAAALKLTAKETAALTTPVKLKSKTVAIEDGKRVKKNDMTAFVNMAFAFLLTIFIFIIVLTYGSLLAQEIATEKGSRIMEILLSSVSATTQFFAKIAGMMALLLTQVVAYVIAGAIAWQFVGHQAFVRDFLKEVDLSVLWSSTSLIAGLFFVLGVLTFSVLAALMGSLVSNQEQVQAAVMPLSLFSLISYVLGFMAQAGDSMLLTVASYLPFLNIGMMPVQLALGHATAGQAVISLVIGTVFLIGFTAVTVAIYRSNVLVYSDASIWKGMRQSFSIWRAERRQG